MKENTEAEAIFDRLLRALRDVSAAAGLMYIDSLPEESEKANGVAESIRKMVAEARGRLDKKLTLEKRRTRTVSWPVVDGGPVCVWVESEVLALGLNRYTYAWDALGMRVQDETADLALRTYLELIDWRRVHALSLLFCRYSRPERKGMVGKVSVSHARYARLLRACFKSVPDARYEQEVAAAVAVGHGQEFCAKELNMRINRISTKHAKVQANNAMIRCVALYPSEFDSLTFDGRQPVGVPIPLNTGAKAYCRGGGWWDVMGDANDGADVRIAVEKMQEFETHPEGSA